MAPEPNDAPEPARFRWQTLFQAAAEPIFVLSRRRRLLFVNAAWEALTGLRLADVKGQVCRRRPRGILAETTELILGAMTPPTEALQGQPAETRRHVPLAAPAWWRVAFFPLAAQDGVAGILGKINVLPRPAPTRSEPLSEKLLALRQRHVQQYRLNDLVGEAPVTMRLREQVRLAAQTRLPVLLSGPPGTGKHWAARTIHHLGPASERPFATLDCARIPADLLDEILSGSRQLTGAIYLKDVDRLPRDLQGRLLAALDVEVGPRVFAGLRQEPREAVRAGLMDGLYCRLSPLELRLPPLTERMGDFAEWTARLLVRANQAADRQVQGVSAEAELLLRAHSWPGNLTELYEVLMRACMRAKGSVIEPGDLPFHLRHGPLPAEKPLNLDAILEEVERRLMVQALRLAGNNKSRAAELLTIWRARLLRRMETLGIEDS